MLLKTRPVLIILLFGFFIIPFHGLRSQCMTSTSVPIPDNGSDTIEFFISGLIDNLLSGSTQGICGVDLTFNHEYLSDLTITLISPAGTMVQLVGPVSTTTDNTNLTSWDVHFIPCGNPAMPDAGINGVWSNDEDWQSIVSYTGSYHPHNGCLEDFNTGSANGIWRLVVEDHGIFQLGSIVSATLIFCNPAGLSCEPCNPNAGALTPPGIQLCENDVFSTSSVTVDFQENVPGPEYDYQYVITNGSTISAYGPVISTTLLPGNYNVCGISYFETDSMALRVLLEGGNYNALTQAIANNAICGAITSSCIGLQVIAVPDTVFATESLCPGNTIVYRGQLFSNPGTYHLTANGTGLCDSVFQLQVLASDLVIDIQEPDTITCGGPGVILDGSQSSSSNGNISYHWTTQNGSLMGNVFSSQVTARSPGIYTLMIEDDDCEQTADVIVFGDNSFPIIFVEGGELTCTDPSFTIHPVVIPSNVSYSWTGPNGFSSNMQDIVVTDPGEYILQVTSPGGCSNTASVVIVNHMIPPDATINERDRDCVNMLGVIGTPLTGMLYEWGGPAGPYAPNQAILVPPGDYSLTLTDPATGCSATSTISYFPDFILPNIIISGFDSIRCNQSVNLFLDPTGILPNPYWGGPHGIVSGTLSATIIEAGSYFVQVIGTNGCRLTQTFEIFNSADYPTYQIVNDTITCLEPTGTIGINYPEADVYQWLNQPSPQGMNAFLNVTVPTTYQVTAIDTHSGCTIKAIARLIANTTPPQFGYTTDTVSCNDPIAMLQLIPGTGQPYTNVQWQFPDMTTSLGDQVNVTEPGQYLLSVTGANGCVTDSIVRVVADTLGPLFFLETDTLGCDLNGQIKNIRVDSLINISWTGPNGFTFNDYSPMVTDTGWYVATGTGINGCISELMTYVHGDFDPPQRFLSADTLGCISEFAKFQIDSPDSILNYEWTDQNGVVLSMTDSLLINIPGTYYIRLEGLNHCISNDTIRLDPAVYPIITVTLDTLTCRDTTVTIIATANIESPSFIWYDENGNQLSDVADLGVSDTGPFIISVIGDNGCESRDTILIPIDTIPPVASIDLMGEIRCQMRDFMLDGSSSMPDAITYSWSTDFGNILSPKDDVLINASDTGTYYLMVVRDDNGCEDVDSILMGEHPDAITGVLFEIVPPQCSGYTNAQIIITDLLGGVGNIIYQLEGGPAQFGNVFDQLSAGDYILTVTDEEGCIYDSLITINPTNEFFIDAGPDKEIFIGQSAMLEGMSDILLSDLSRQEWDSLGVILCHDCPDFEVRPFETTTYTFTVESVTGCVKSDEMVVYVIERGQFYVPNIFSPNGDQINDEVRVNVGPGIERVLQWIIFDRWGNAVYGKTDFDPVDPSVFWNGTMQGGEPMNPAVFPYVLELRLINGNIEFHKGNITLIR